MDDINATKYNTKYINVVFGKKKKKRLNKTGCDEAAIKEVPVVRRLYVRSYPGL